MNRVVHFDIAANDPEKISAFYRDVFGWEFTKWDGPMDYWMIKTGGDGTPGIDGGVGRASDDSPAGITNTVGVTDLDAMLRKVQANGGSVVVGKMAVPGVGWLAYVTDVEGNLFGMMQDDTSAQ